VPEANVKGIKVVYDVFGDGEPILLVCGTGQRAFTWQLFQVPALTAAGYRVVTFDNRGVPPSDAPSGPYTVQLLAEDAAALIEHLDLAPCRVAGLSLGAFITQELALARPDLVRQAVMMGTIGRQDEFGRALTRAWVELDESGIELPRIVEAVNAAFEAFSPHALRDDQRVKQYFEFVQQMPRWENPGRLAQHQADQAYDDRLEALAEITVPSMVIAFELDMLTGRDLCLEVAKAIPGCRYEEIPACGHAGPLEKPEEVNRLLLDFFGSD
jgi:pimeloyl-ACP methyl ester carboxylesterase